MFLTGRAGVDRLLKTLRDESQIRLLKADAHIPQELKVNRGGIKPLTTMYKRTLNRASQ